VTIISTVMFVAVIAIILPIMISKANDTAAPIARMGSAARRRDRPTPRLGFSAPIDDTGASN
jgi:hypothetical protein